jgi:hypothetical protein
MKLIAYQRLRLAKMVMAVDEESDKGPLLWEWMPPSEGDTLHVRIPVALLQQLLARKRRKSAKSKAGRKGTTARPRLSLPLARVVIPLHGRKNDI